MTRRLPTAPAPGPLEEYAACFDDLFDTLAQRQAFRRYLEGLLLPAERNKTLTALANTEPVVGAQRKEAQGLQWFLSESTWEPAEINARRLELSGADPKTAPDERGVLVIDEHGDREWGNKTAHVGKQYLANIGKVQGGVVSVSSLWADEEVYYPLEVEPYTPAHHFEKGKVDSGFRTKLKIALELVKRSVEGGMSFRAVVADSFYGEDEEFKMGLDELGAGYVLSLKRSHCWWHKEGDIGALWEAAEAAGWQSENEPGQWVRIVRAFRDSHQEEWWALEIEAGPYGPERARRAVVVTTDPERLPTLATWHLVTNLPAPGYGWEKMSEHPSADLAEVVRLYGLRMWVEQSYKQVKYALGFSNYQVRGDRAIRCHWQLVCCAFSFCWWAQRSSEDGAAGLELGAPPRVTAEDDTEPSAAPQTGAREKKERKNSPSSDVVAGSIEGGEGMARALCNAVAILESVHQSAPATKAKSAA